MTLADLQALIAPLAAIYGPMFLALLGLTAADVLTGIGSAWHRGKFQWNEVANFYRTTIGPKLLVWVALVIVTATVSSSILTSAAAGVVVPVTATGAFAFIVVDFFTSIATNIREILAPVPPPAKPLL